MSQEVDTSEWTEMDYNGRNSAPITYKGYMRRDYRVHVLPGGEIKQTGAAVRRAATVLVHPDDVPRLQRLIDRGTQLFTLSQEADTEALAEAVGAKDETTATGDTPVDEQPPRDSEGDDLTAINGIGGKTAVKLNEAGIFTYDQLAEADTEALAEAVGAKLDVVIEWQSAAQELSG